MNERLSELIEKAIRYADEHYPQSGRIEDGRYVGLMAECLIADGVIVPPCSVNQFVYVIDRADIRQPIKEKIVLEIQCGYDGNLIVLQDTPFRLRRAYHFGDIGKTVFLTREEAEKALAERK